MLKRCLCIILLLDVPFIFAQNYAGPYFGQKPPGKIPDIFAPGFISLEDRFEQNVAFTPDGKEFYFSTTTSDWGGFHIYYTEQIEGEWTEPQNAASILGIYDNTEPFITHDGQKLLFVSPRPSAPPWDTDIWICERNDTSWSAPQKVPNPVSTTNREWHPSVSLNGTLYFQSLDRSGGFGAADIYRSKLNNGVYTTAENLGNSINSSYGDGEATIAPDESYLIFTSQRPGYGQSDIYITFSQNNSWTEPLNLGPEINTDQIEYGTALSPDGKYLFFTRRKAWKTNEDSDIYWVSTSFIDSLKNITSIDKKELIGPKGFHLFQNYSNPFNPSTTIEFDLPKTSEVTLKILNILGEEVATLVSDRLTAGGYTYGRDAGNLASGVYLYRLEAGNYIETRKMLLMR